MTMVDSICPRVVVSAIVFEFAHSHLYRMHSREVESRGRPFGSTAFSIRGSVRISAYEKKKHLHCLLCRRLCIPHVACDLVLHNVIRIIHKAKP